MYKKMRMQCLSLLLLSVVSVFARAHTGHGSSSLIQHDMEHSVWLLAGVAMAAAVAFAAVKKINQKR